MTERLCQLVPRTTTKGYEHMKECVEKLGWTPLLVAAWTSTYNLVVWEKEKS